MTNIDIHSFDTYRYVQEFKANGFTEEQAAVVVRTVLESKEYDFSKLATKEQLHMLQEQLHMTEERMDAKVSSLEERLEAKISSVEERLEAKINLLASEMRIEMANVRAEMANMQSNLVKWMVGLMFAQSTLILGILLKLFY